MAVSLQRLVRFFKEVWRRHVLQVAIPYGIGAWLLVQIAEVVLDAFESPPWVMQIVLGILVLGLPVAVVLAWIFDLTPKGSLVVTKPLPETDSEESQPESRPTPALSLEMGHSERRQITMLQCVFEAIEDGDPEVDPEYLRDSLTVLNKFSNLMAKRYSAYRLPSGAEELTLVFGYPQARDDDARRAVATSLALIHELDQALADIPGRDGPRFSVRIGVATSLVVVGKSEPGDGKVSIVGIAPRMASWLQSLAPPGSVLIGPQTRKLVTKHYQITDFATQAKTQFGDDFIVYQAEASKPSGSLISDELIMTGRDHEFHRLEKSWDNVLEGDGQFAVVRGEPGIGKSTLVQVFENKILQDPNARSIRCQCSPYDRHNALSPVIHTLRGPILQLSNQDSSAVRVQKLAAFLENQSADVDRSLPLLASLLSLDTGPEYPPPSGSAQNVRSKTLELVLNLICGRAARSPLLMIVEDLHWADPSTLEMLQMLADRGPSPGLFMLFSTRPEFSTEWMNRSHVLLLDLEPLTRRNAREMLESTEGSEDLPPALVDRIIKETHGNPLFIREMTLAMIESDHWRKSLAEGKAEDMRWLQIPATLKDSLTARIDNLGEAKALLQLCSVLGREFFYDLLRAVSGTENEAALKKELEHCVNSELLYQRGVLENLTYTFKHFMILETAYHTLLKSKRRELHNRTAQILEQEIAEVKRNQPALLAHHYSAAGDLEKAIFYWTQASRRSISGFANLEAVEQCHRGIELIDSLPDSAQRAELEIPLQSVLGTALLATHGYADPGVRTVYTKALSLCEQIGDAPQLFQVAVGLWMYYFIAGHDEEALDLSQRLLRIAQSTDNPAQYLQSRYCLSFTQYSQANFLAAKSHLENAMASEVKDCDYAVQSASGDDTRIHVRVVLAMVNWQLGFPKTAIRMVNESNVIAARQNHPWGITFACVYSAWLHQMRGDVKLTLKHAELAASIAEEKGFKFWLPVANFFRAWAQSRIKSSSLEPRDASGVEQMTANLDRYRSIGAMFGVTYLGCKIAEDYIDLKRYEQATKQLEGVMASLDKGGEVFFESEYHRLHGRIRLNRFKQDAKPEDLDAATDYFQQALTIAQHHESKILALRAGINCAEVRSLRGKHMEAFELLNGIVQGFDEFDDSSDCVQANQLLKALKKKTRG